MLQRVTALKTLHLSKLWFIMNLIVLNRNDISFKNILRNIIQTNQKIITLIKQIGIASNAIYHQAQTQT
jgi:hypothetical protein